MKLIVTDYDGTLYFKDDLDLTKYNIACLNDAIGRGYKVVVNTARQKIFIESLLQEVGFQLTGLISSNGAEVTYMEQTIFKKSINLSTHECLMPTLKKFIGKIEYQCSQYSQHFTDNQYPTEDLLMYALWHTDTEYLEYFNRLILDEKPDLTTSVDKEILMVNEANVSKLSGLQRLVKYLGIDKYDVYTFGNADNDIPMVCSDFNGHAVSGSSPRLLELAPYKGKYLGDFVKRL